MYAKIHYHIGQYLANDLVDFFFNNNIIIIDYRAKSHAKSSNKSRIFNKMKDIIIYHSAFSIWIPISALCIP